MGSKYNPYNRLLVLPFRDRMVARARIARGESIYGGGLVHYQAPEPGPEVEDARDEDGEWKAVIVPEPIRRLQAAFELLDLEEQGATLKRAKKAYHKAAFKTHPDHGGSEDEFKAVKAAYDLVVQHLRR